MDKIYIAMWSGPRNISTALMRSFENRPDTVVLDEPFYGFFLKETNLNHPGKKDIISKVECDWGKIVEKISGPIPQKKNIWYQKHMAQHILNRNDISWIKKFKNCILIRHPRYVIPSYSENYPVSHKKLLGYSQQLNIIRILQDKEGITPPIFDATDIQKNPRVALKKMCISIGISFSEKMLKWPKGKRKSDGVWAKYWYENVESSSGFKPFYEKHIIIEKERRALYKECLTEYKSMYEKRVII